MKLVALTMVAAGFVLYAASATAGPNCTCRANGTRFEIGQIACINLPSGSRLAQCEMVLNNTSWKFLGGSCPTAGLEIRDFLAPMSLPADNSWHETGPSAPQRHPGDISAISG